MKKLASFIFLTGAAACASSEKPSPVSVAADARVDTALLLTGLPDSALPKGKCGMILWTLESDRPMAVLKYVVGEGGEIGLNGALAKIKLEDASGVSAFGVFERQTFAGESGFSASVSFQFGLGFNGGSYVERGLIAIEAANGWRLAAPTAGIAGCRR
jgi:hypothetical protein